MTPQEAINRIKEFGLYHAIKDLPHSAYTVEAFEMAIEALEQMEKDRWIPVTERLPKLNEPVLFCNDYGSVFVSAITWMSEDGNAWCIGKRHRKARVIAWMPRPKPYKEGTR